MKPTRLAVTLLQHLGRSFKKDNFKPVTGILERSKDPVIVFQELALANVDAQSDSGNVGHISFAKIEKSGEHRHRQVVNTEIVEIFEGLDGSALPRTGEARNHDYMDFSLFHSIPP